VQFIVEPDGIVRRWRLWEPVCDHGVPLALPSVELLLPALVNSGSSTAQADSVRLERLLHRAAPTGCGNADEHGSTGFRSDVNGGPPVDSLWGKPVRISTDLVPQRIVYQIPWREEGRQPDVGNVALPTGGVGPLFSRIRAGEVTREPDTPSSGALTGRIVIIGGSFQQGRDLHQTPIGPMPGAMVVANSIASFRSHGQLQPLAWPWRLVAIAILGLLAALTYAHFHPLLATGITGLVLLFVVAPISFLVFRGSVWLDFAVPLLGIQLHELIADLEDAWTLRGRRPDPPSGTAH
jgi:hypothetical protein